MKRFGSVIEIRHEMIGKYKQLHAHPWEKINEKIKECNISNYSIYLKENMLFSYYEYDGLDYETDMKKMEEDPRTQEWWRICKPCQVPLQTRAVGEWWADMEEVYHLD